MRGGSWNNNPENCRSASRNNNNRDNRNNTIGFRVVCESPSTLLCQSWLMGIGRVYPKSPDPFRRCCGIQTSPAAG
ncbi:MAG: SUMF1/EgtB/PvdO family nonheme iron enzyme [Cyanobacteria bacterium P01_E01_bin.34]